MQKTTTKITICDQKNAHNIIFPSFLMVLISHSVYNEINIQTRHSKRAIPATRQHKYVVYICAVYIRLIHLLAAFGVHAYLILSPAMCAQ